MIRSDLVLQELKKRSVTHVVGLPDNTSARLIARINQEPQMKFITVTREAEAFAIAAGLWMGGKTPVVLVQNTGFLESGDGFRGTASRMRIPLLCLITYRGYRKMGRRRASTARQMRKVLFFEDFRIRNIKSKIQNWLQPSGRAVTPILDADTLSRADLDSVALITEPTFRAWGISFDFLHEEEDLKKISVAFQQAEMQSHPIVLLITDDLS
jgi:sulfopyruvate decarboxylase TPP-binding subunit